MAQERGFAPTLAMLACVLSTGVGVAGVDQTLARVGLRVAGIESSRIHRGVVGSGGNLDALLTEAADIATSLESSEVTNKHLLLAFLSPQHQVERAILESVGVPLDQLHDMLLGAEGDLTIDAITKRAAPHASPRLAVVLEEAPYKTTRVGASATNGTVEITISRMELTQSGMRIHWSALAIHHVAFGMPVVFVMDDVDTSYDLASGEFHFSSRAAEGVIVAAPRPPVAATKLLVEFESFSTSAMGIPLLAAIDLPAALTNSVRIELSLNSP
jgi:hypothetical protein